MMRQINQSFDTLDIVTLNDQLEVNDDDEDEFILTYQRNGDDLGDHEDINIQVNLENKQVAQQELIKYNEDIETFIDV